MSETPFKAFEAAARACGFELDSQVPHAERRGAEGATNWVARRHAG